MLARDRRQLLDDAVQQPRLLDGFAETDVEHDLLDAGDLVRVLEPVLLLQLRTDLVLVERAESRRRNRQSRARVRAARLFLALARLLSAATLLFLFFRWFRCRSHVSRLCQRLRVIASPLLMMLRSLVSSSSLIMHIRVVSTFISTRLTIYTLIR